MSDFTYFRIGVPKDMVADIMWHDDFEVSIESYSKPETNYQRYFGTPAKAAETIMRITTLCYSRKCSVCPLYYTDCIESECIAEWLKGEAE